MSEPLEPMVRISLRPWMSSVAASPVKTLASQDLARDSTASARGSGFKWCDLFASFDRPTSGNNILDGGCYLSTHPTTLPFSVIATIAVVNVLRVGHGGM